MSSKLRFVFIAGLIVCAVASRFQFSGTNIQAATTGNIDSAAVGEASDEGDAVEPVEADMHEFMEYVFEPTFKRLVPAMAAAPANNQGWKSIKSDALILAEACNLLVSRQPEEDGADWVKHSVEVRDLGGQLYRAAKAKDFDKARQHYEAMVESCNACHRQFENGKHILKP